MNPVAWLLSRLLGLGDWLYVALSATSKAKFFADGFGDADTTKRIEAFYKGALPSRTWRTGAGLRLGR